MPDGKNMDGAKPGRRLLTGAQLLAKLMPAEVTLRFVHISDTHISHDPSYMLPEASHTPVAGARALVDAINNLPFTPDFVLHTGDVAYDPDPLAYVTARDVLSQIRFPIYYLNGNHDDRELLQRIMLDSEPLTPFDYQFEAKGVQVVVVDSNGPAQQPAGFVTSDQLARLEGICKDTDERPLVIAVHHNVLPTGIPWWDDFMRMTNGEDFHQALLPARHRLRGVFHGHVHQPVDTYRDGILYSGVVSSWYQLHAWPDQSDTLGDALGEPGFNVVTVTPNQTFIRRHHVLVQPERTRALRAEE
jgi:Icc protein